MIDAIVLCFRRAYPCHCLWWLVHLSGLSSVSERLLGTEPKLSPFCSRRESLHRSHQSRTGSVLRALWRLGGGLVSLARDEYRARWRWER